MTENKNTQVANKEYNTGLNTYLKAYVPMIQKQIAEDGETFDDYSRYCVVAAMGEIISMVHNSGADPSTINPNNLNDILLSVARLKLNANAVPRECYFQIRNVNVAGKGQAAKWEKQVEFNIEGDGYDALTARYGRGVKKVYPYWAVRERDTFVPPKHRGLEVTPPEWEESGEGKVARVVYPIEYTDGHIEYHVAERADVAKNLAAHINNNMQNETFGICADRYKATDKQKQEIAAKKREIMDKIRELGDVEAILSCEELKPYISPSWSEYQSQESMIIRKMRNNIMKKIPKDFGSAAVAHTYNMIDDGVYREVHEEIEANANKEEFVVEEPAQIEEKHAPKTVADVYTGVREPVGKDTNVPAKEKKQEVPSFMQMEDM